MTDIVEENRSKLAKLLTGRENWHPEVAGEDGEPGWCFGVEGAGRLTILPEMDGFLVQVEGQKKTWVIPRIESVEAWLDEHEQEYAGPTALQVEFKGALEAGEIRPFGEGGGGAGA